MKYLWRRLTGRCASCGQKLNSKQTAEKRLLEINNKAAQLAGALGRQPQTQGCNDCHRIILEGEPEFVQRYLLIDMK